MRATPAPIAAAIAVTPNSLPGEYFDQDPFRRCNLLQREREEIESLRSDQRERPIKNRAEARTKPLSGLGEFGDDSGAAGQDGDGGSAGAANEAVRVDAQVVI